MRALILYNPHSGRGRGERVAQSVAAMLRQRTFDVSLIATAKEPPDAFHKRLAAALAGIDLLVVAGGDGTLHRTLPVLAGSGVPVYHLAMGTENLFARQFGMDRLPRTLDEAVAKWKTVDVDLGVLKVGGVPHHFGVMCSLGPDASVIRRMDDARTGPISHLTYFKPILAEFMSPWLPEVTMDVDGKRVVTDQRGIVVIANSRQYAVRIDPAHKASMTDGLLDVVFLPCEGRIGALASVVRSRLRSHGKSVVYVHGRSVHVRADDPRPALQIDGEQVRLSPGIIDLRAEVLTKALKVLTP